ncbi:MAG TPA: M56 family metallopeptidase [Sphingomicrobium sp.]|nr:M56 family metallopeptidase [Sphingomicrobium sp.]
MEWFVLLAAKSLLVAGGVLLLLQLMRGRSAADRSFVAHLGLAALVLLPVAALALPAFEVSGPAFLTPPPPEVAIVEAPALAPEVATPAATFRGAAEPAVELAGAIDWALWLYALPAALLFLLTLIAIARLVPLKARAQVLVDQHWLTALAHAQRRMGFKNGTALLTSDDIRSPISWGLMRPVILLNSDAAGAKDEAEAIIAHELAHVARLDWAKLLLARITVAIFWFNPLVWLLAREAHQLREEAADDAVLAANIDDTEYARLLVGIARHECRGLLLGAHGVAPARNSLARRVQRVLDAASARAPGGWRWSAAAGFFAAGMAVPVAALQIVPSIPAAANAAGAGTQAAATSSNIAPAAATAAAIAPSEVATATPALTSQDPRVAKLAETAQAIMTSPNGGTIDVRPGVTVMRSPDGGVIRVHAPDEAGRQRATLTSPSGATIAVADARAVPGLANVTAHPAPPRPPAPPRTPDSAIDRAIAMKAVGATPEYVQSIRRAAPHMRFDHDDIVAFAALGVSPAYLRELASAGYSRITADDLTAAKAIGVSGAYARSIAASGYGLLPVDRLIELKAVGVTASDIERYRRALGRLPSVDKLVAMKAMGVKPDEIDHDRSP